MATPKLSRLELLLPVQIFLPGEDYTLDFVEPESELLEGNDALTHLNTGKVYLRAGLSATRLFNLVWHEVTHCVNYAARLDDESTEEEFTTAHGFVWPAFLLMNPNFYRWISECIDRINLERDIG